MANPILFTAIAIKWRDKINGNTYHSVRIIRTFDGAEITAPFQYGYGDQYRQSALKAISEAGWLPSKYGKHIKCSCDECTGRKVDGYMSYERNNNYPIYWTVSDGLKRECIANGKVAL